MLQPDFTKIFYDITWIKEFYWLLYIRKKIPPPAAPANGGIIRGQNCSLDHTSRFCKVTAGKGRGNTAIPDSTNPENRFSGLLIKTSPKAPWWERCFVLEKRITRLLYSQRHGIRGIAGLLVYRHGSGTGGHQPRLHREC